MFGNRKAVVRRYYELFDKGDFEGIEKLLANNLSWKFPGQPEPLTKETLGPLNQAFSSAFPDMTHTINRQISEGDWVATALTFRGTHKGELMGIPPSGNVVINHGLNVHKVVGGKIVEAETVFDMLSIMQQIGAIPKQG